MFKINSLFGFLFFLAIISCNNTGEKNQKGLLSTGQSPDEQNVAANDSVAIKMFSEEGVRATGNEPFWMAEINHDSLHFSLMGDPEFHLPLNRPVINNQDSVEFSLKLDNGQITVLFTNKPCVDNMSGFKKKFSTSVLLRQENKEDNYHGCADYLSVYRSQIMEGE